VIPLSLGLETMGGVVEKVILRNSPIPTAQAQIFTTFQTARTGWTSTCCRRARAGRRLSIAGRFRLTGIPELPAGMGRVEVRFQVDADGILSVSAKEQSTGLSQAITVKPTHGLSDEEIEQMLLDSIDHAEDDMQRRQLAEQQVEAKQILVNAHKQLIENGDLLSEDEKRAFVDGSRPSSSWRRPRRITSS